MEKKDKGGIIGATIILAINKCGNTLLEIIFRICWFIADTARTSHHVNTLMGDGYGTFGKFALMRGWEEEEKIREQSRKERIRRLRNA